MQKWLKENWFKVGVLALAIVVIAGGFYTWNENKEREYFSARQEKCIELSEEKKSGLEEGNQVKSKKAGGTLLRTGKYTYSRELDDCIFERLTTTISSEGSFMLYGLEGLFSGKEIVANQIISLEEGEKENARKNCEYYNEIRKKYFDEGISCSL